MIATIRKRGNSFVITVPRKEMERLGLEPGDHVLVEIRPVDVRPTLIPELKRIADELVDRPETAEAYSRLADS